MAAHKSTHPVGTSVIYRHEGKARKAQVTSHHSETGEVDGLAVYGSDGQEKPTWVVEFGVTDPKHAEVPQHEITDGYFHKVT